VIGRLFGAVGGHSSSDFIPYLAAGLIFWTLVGGVLTRSASVFQRNRSNILQGNLGLDDIVIQELIAAFIQFMHQLLVLAATMMWYQVPVSFYSLLSLVGLVFLLINGYWVVLVFGILGARYRDLSEVFQAVMRMAMLATPIIWMPGSGGRGGLIGPYLMFNPFYHFIEIVRSPLLDRPIDPLSWPVVLVFTVVGLVLASVLSSRYSRNVPLWV
jgi:ABC-2 type transport system permease protein/lipopolysaccharide transport system permease protein